MQLIPDTINLRDYMPGPKFAPQVRPASDFLIGVKARLAPREQRPRYPAILLRKAKDLIEFRPGELTLWGGYSGARKSMLTTQVALDLSVQRQKSLIVSLEMPPEETMARMCRQAAGSHEPSMKSIEDFHTWTDGRLWLFDHQGRLDPQTTLALCRYFAVELGGQHVFLDSWMMICATEERMDEQKQFATDLVRLAQETGLHVHVIAHCRKPHGAEETKPPSKYDIKGTGAISDQAHNVLLVWANKEKKSKLEENAFDTRFLNDPDGLLICDKQRNGAWEGRLRLWFDEGSMRFRDDQGSALHPYQLTDSPITPDAAGRAVATA